MTANLKATVSALSEMDPAMHIPGATRRFIVPKDHLAYRQATQLDPVDSVLLTALIKEFGQLIEDRRGPRADGQVFSYRLEPSTDGALCSGPNAWNAFWDHCADESTRPKVMLVADITDLYNQIYHHTIENQLAESAWRNPAIKMVINILESVSAKVSRGVPVGPHWIHLIAEASLIPIDNSLAARGLRFARFVDDIVVFCSSEIKAQEAVYASVRAVTTGIFPGGMCSGGYRTEGR